MRHGQAEGEPSAFFVDTRWRGSFGIGRYAAEVTSRFTSPWTSLGLSGRPSSPRDAFRRLPSPTADSLIYTPGYNAFFGRTRQVITLHDLIHLAGTWRESAKYRAYYELVARPVIRRMGIVLTVSETSRDAIREWLRDDAVEVVNAGNAASEVFKPADNESIDAPSDAPYILIVSNMRPHKNVDTVLDALRLVPSDIRLRLVVPSSDLADAENAVAVRGLSARVRVLSGLADSELAIEYRGAFATVMPSLIEGFGLPALESLNCGTPVLYARECAAVAETVGSSGIGVEAARDSEEWASAIVRAATSPPVVEGVGHATTWADVARVVEQTIIRVL